MFDICNIFISNLNTGFLYTYNLKLFRFCRRSGSTTETRRL